MPEKLKEAVIFQKNVSNISIWKDENRYLD